MNKKLEDVAKLAGVSKATASRVINNRGYLSKNTIRKVQKAINDLDYHPNTIARQLFTNRTNLVGILIPTVANPFFGELTYCLEKKLFSQGFKVLIGNVTNDSKEEEKYLKKLLGHQVDGLIVGSHNQGIKEYKRTNLPIVAIERKINSDIPMIDSDNFLGGQLATQALLDSGAKHIIHTDGPLNLETPDQYRRIGYEKIMISNGMTPLTYNLDFNISFVEKKKIFTRIFKEHPEVDGIFAANDVDAILIINIAKSLGYQLPRDLKVIGYDGTKYIQQLFPNLSTIIQPIQEMAEQAVLILEKRINKENTRKEYKLPVKLKRGDTLSSR